MNNLTSTINVQVDTKIKDEAIVILKGLGLDISTFINMALVQVIKHDGIPFEIVNPKPSKKLLEALEECKIIEQEYIEGKRKGYNNREDLKRALLDD